MQAIHGLVAGDAPAIDLAGEKRLQGTLLEAIRAGLVRSAHDCSDGGLAVALAECCLGANGVRIGATIRPEPSGLRPDFYLFGEDQSRVVVSAAPDKAESLIALCAKNDIPARMIGTVGGERLVVGDLIDVGCGELGEAYYTSIENLMA